MERNCKVEIRTPMRSMLIMTGTQGNEQLLGDMYEHVCEQDADYEGCEFAVQGIDKQLLFSSVAFHYCFAKGRISVEQMLEMCHRYWVEKNGVITKN